MGTVDGVEAGLRFGFENSYVRLPERFYARVRPTAVAGPKLIKVNEAFAAALGLDAGALASPAGVEVLAGNVVAEGSEPLAMAYAGHQFGHFVPQLGDGRANLLGEVVGVDGKRYDVQLKGAGRTPFSRGGDGRAALGPVLREYVVSEAMAALGVPTTRALAAVLTGEKVYREWSLPGAVLTRVAASHLRVGTFQYFAARGDVEGLKVLVEYALERHYGDEIREAEIRDAGAGGVKKARLLLEGVVVRSARLVAQWMLLGFVHGVMNTDNTSISGETIDYGPCAFMEAFDPEQVFSSIDANGRYGYGNQHHAMHWNLVRLAEAVLPVLSLEEGSEGAAVESAQAALALFAGEFDGAYAAGMRRKLGLFRSLEGDVELAQDLLERMAEGKADFTGVFRGLAELVGGATAGPCGMTSKKAVGPRALFRVPERFDEWVVGWRVRLAEDGGDDLERVKMMRGASPAVIPRNHLVEAMIRAAVEREDFSLFEEMVRAVGRPFEEIEGMEVYRVPARAEEVVRATFCGT